LFLFFCFTACTEAQQDSLQTRTESKGLIIASNAVLIVPSSLLLLIDHEFGHYVIASIFGAQNVRVGLHIVNGSGWTEWSNDLGRFGNSAACLGGVLFSRGLAEGSDCMIRHTNLPPWGQRFFSMTFIIGRFDFAQYVLQDGFKNLSGKSGSDIDIFVTQIAGHNNNSRFFTYSTLFAIAALDLVLDWDRIVMHWNILKGKSYTNKSIDSHAQLSINPYFTYGSIGISTKVVW
jgi:hypothetical protein